MVPLMPEPLSNPYIGPRPFTRDDAARFFGRDRETAELLSLVVAHRTVLLYAQSGAGKTSLLDAALIPALEAARFDVLPPARVSGLAGVEAATGAANPFVLNSVSRWSAVAAAAPTMLQDALRSIPKRMLDGEPLPRVIVLDQFEELFTAYPRRWKERRGFFEQLDEAMRWEPTLRVLFVIREDFLAHLDPYCELVQEELRTRYRLDKLREDGALEAVVKPLEATPVRFKPGVAEALVTKLRTMPARDDEAYGVELTEYVEPVQLQIVCLNLFQSLPTETTEITDAHLAAFADVDQALADFYEQALRAASPVGVGEDALRLWFETKLITEAGTRGLVFRGAADTGGMSNDAIDRLDALHIIRPEVRGRDRWYELSHDRFVQPILRANNSWRQRRRRSALVRKWGTAVVVCLLSAAAVTFALWRSVERAREAAVVARLTAEEKMLVAARAEAAAAASRQEAGTQAQEALDLAKRYNLPISGINPAPVRVQRESSPQAGPGETPGARPRTWHVIVVMLENRSFDHMLGYGKAVHRWDGLAGDETNPDTNGAEVAVSPDAAFRGQFVPDPSHTFAGVEAQVFDGDRGATRVPTMRGFVRSYFQQMNDVEHSHLIMRAFSSDKLPVLTTLASEFAVCDRWFSSLPGPGAPNHLYAHFGTSFGRVDPSPVHDPTSVPSIFERLAAAGRTAKIYVADPGTALGLASLAFRRPQFFATFEQFFDDARQGALPDYSFVEPSHFDSIQTGNAVLAADQHPDHDVREGERFIARVYNAVRTGPGWLDSILLVTYSNHGGFFDHVPPPATVNPDGLVDRATGFDFSQLGVRVPAVVVSPYVPKGTIVHDVFDHSSIPATVSKLLIHRADQQLMRERQAFTFERLLTLSSPRFDAPRFDLR
jgi:phospholipase C